MRLFPQWAEALGIDARLVGRDLTLDASAEDYRRAVEEIRADAETRGALVTTHKLALFAAAADLFDELGPYARQLGEVSSVSKRDGRLIGHAKDPITAGQALESVLGDRHFADTGGDALVLGAGGAGAAIVLYLRSRGDRPRRIAVTDVVADRLSDVAALGDGIDVGLADESAALLAELPPGSLVVNATGMGKDRPGSPLAADALFPRGGVVWELNYRGELGFLAAARAQSLARDLRVEDGWLYFLRGWTSVIADVFDVSITDEQFDRLREIAVAMR